MAAPCPQAAELEDGDGDGDDERAGAGAGGAGGAGDDPMTQLSGEDMLLMMDSDRSGRVSFEEYLLGGEQGEPDEP
jgi:hypothetical protein